MSNSEGLPQEIGSVAGQLLCQLDAYMPSLEATDQALVVDLAKGVRDLREFVSTGKKPALRSPWTSEACARFGRLLRDKRCAAGFSRVTLARKAKLSDATIKFIETAKNVPSRATLIRLINLPELKLTWADVPGHPLPPAAPSQPAPEEGDVLGQHLNVYVSQAFDSVQMVMELGRLLQGPGGYLEQTSAYLDHQSAAAYLEMCRQSPVAASLRAEVPLGKAAEAIMDTGLGEFGFNVVALGAGSATLEVRLVQSLLQSSCPRIELCLVDVSQPMLCVAYRHAADVLGDNPQVRVWGMQCNFHELPVYSALHFEPRRVRRRRLFFLLGCTLANLDDEPRFFQHSLADAEPDDLMVLDFQQAVSEDPVEIKKLDHAYKAGVPLPHQKWLAGPIWRHCKDISSVDFQWRLETHCPVPGSYALNAIATAHSNCGPDRAFSVFRFRRYNAVKLAACLAELRWVEVARMTYGERKLGCLAIYRRK